MGDEKIRLFVAASVPRDLLQALDEATAALRSRFPQARWVPVENQHVTLKFVGWFPAARLDEADGAVARAVRGVSLADISLSELGAFPSQRRMRVLWIGLEDPSRTLATIARSLDDTFEPLGIPVEQRGFSPHLTLARFRTPVPAVEPLPDLTLARSDFRLTSVELYSSRLSPGGAQYEILRSFPLDG
ncbi:MAG: RNA 2',3'-cyclic phosphodiesterase [Actinomycetota bacterium]|nr:RNA 2',3'-cyclic phosphodiesterase [Actinomycetota bacterium]